MFGQAGSVARAAGLRPPRPLCLQAGRRSRPTPPSRRSDARSVRLPDAEPARTPIAPALRGTDHAHMASALRCSERARDSGDPTMLHYAVVFLVIALIAAVLGFGGIAAGAAGIAKILFIVFVILAVATFLFGRNRGG